MFEELKHRVVSVPVLEMYDMVAPTLRWWYTLMPAPKCLVPYFSRNMQLPNTFNPIVYYSKKFNNV